LAGTTLGRIASDVIATAVLFREAPDGMRPELPALRNHLLALLDAFVRHPAAQGVPEEVDEARFALVALADEMIIVSDWSQRERWRADSLQLQLYQTNRAGDEFYERLAALRPDQNQAREVYYACLALGFEGRYAGREADRAELMRQQFEMLRAAHHALDIAAVRPVAPPAYDVSIHIKSVQGRRLWSVLAGWTATVAVFFAAFWITLRWLAAGVPLPPGS
jgi:type VI secretion system protein ImpK